MYETRIDILYGERRLYLWIHVLNKMSPRFKRSLKGWWCIHVFQRVGECVFSFSLHHPARCFFFCSCKMHVFFLCFSVFLNVILVSYKSEIAFQPLAPGVFLSQPRFFFLLANTECRSGFLLYSHYEKLRCLIKQYP